jgi:PAS domain S-box-containing protein
MVYTCEAFGDFDATYISENISSITGYTSKDFLSKGFWASHIHPDDASVVFKNLEQLFKNNLHKHEYRFRFKDGLYYWMHDELKLVKDNKGKPVKIIGTWTNINERKEQENIFKIQNDELFKVIQEVEISEARYKNIVEHTSEWIWELDQTGAVTYSNSIVEQMLGYTVDDLIGKNNIGIIHKTDRSLAVKMFLDTVKLKKGWRNMELKWSHKDGGYRILESSAVPILNRNGNIEGYRGVNRDITERKKAEEENKKLSTAVEQSANSIIITDSKGNIEYTNPKFSEVTGYSAEEMLTFNPITSESRKQHNALYTELWKTISNHKTWSGTIKNIDKKGDSFWERATISPISNNEGEITNYLAVMENVSELRESEEKFKLLLESSEDMITVHNLDGDYLYYNGPSCYDLSKEEVIGRTPYDFFEKENADRLVKTIKSVGKTKISKKIEIKLNWFDEKKWFSEYFYPIKGTEKGEVQIVKVCRDINDQKKAEEENKKLYTSIEESEKKFRELFEKSGDSIVILKNGTFIDCNNAALVMFNFKTKEGILKALPSDISPKFQPDGLPSLEKSEEMVKIALEKGTHRFEWTHTKSNKEDFPAEVLLTTITNEPNNLVIHGVIRDITHQKKAEEENKKLYTNIQESEKKFRELFEKSSDAILIIKNGVFVDCNKATVKMLKHKSKEAFLNTHPSELSPELQPDGLDSKKKAEQMMALALKKGSHRFEWMHTKSNKKEFPVEVLLTTMTNEPNKKIIHCVWRDVTDQKKAEEEIVKAKKIAEESERYLLNIINNMGDAVYVKDGQRKLILVNDAFCKTFELSEDDIIGKSHSQKH